jgi:hypothetical protein
MLMVQGGVAVFQADNKEVDVMLEERKTRRTTDPVHLGLNEQRKPLLRGEAYHYLIALGDQRALAAEVVRFGFSPSDFALEIQRVPSKRSPRSAAATFAMTVENVQNRRRASYLVGPGRSWIAGFLEDLIAGTFGRP